MSRRLSVTVRFFRKRRTGFALLVCLIAVAHVQPTVAQEDAAAVTPSASAEQWDELRTEWMEQSLAEVADDDSAVQDAAIDYLAANPPENETWNEFVRNQLRSEDLDAVNQGMELLASTSIELDGRVELIRIALTAAGDQATDQTVDKRRTSAVSRPQSRVTRETVVAHQIVEKAESYFNEDPALYEAVVKSMLADDDPAPSVFSLLFRSGTDDIEVGRRLLELTNSDKKETAAMASRVLNAVLRRAPTTAPVPITGAPVADKYLQYAGRIVSRYDKDNEGTLTADEWKQMLVDPSPADSDGNGRITAEEYGRWLQHLQSR